MKKVSFCVGLFGLLSLATLFPAKAETTVWVGFSAGGGYDASARVFAQHYSKHLPGNPSVVVRNKQGSGSAKLLGFLYKQAGTSPYDVGFFMPTIMQAAVFGKREMRFSPLHFNYVGNMYSDINSCAVWKGAGRGIATLEDLQKAKQPVIFGSAHPSTTMSIYPLFLKNVFGVNVKVIQGYRGTRRALNAMQRGEIHGACGFYESSIRTRFFDDWKNGNLNPVVQIDAFRKSKLFNKATSLYSFLKTKEQRAMADFVFGVDRLTRPVLASPVLSPSQVAVVRKAFMDTMNDPVLRLDMKKRFGIDPDPSSGAEVQSVMEKMVKTPKAVVEKVWEVTRPSQKK